MKLLVQDHTWKKNVLTYPQVLLLSISSHLYPGRTEAEAPILWPPDAKSQITGKDPGAGKDWGQEKGVREDEMVRCNTSSMDMSLNKLREIVKDRETWRAAVHGVTKSWTWPSDWTPPLYPLVAFVAIPAVPISISWLLVKLYFPRHFLPTRRSESGLLSSQAPGEVHQDHRSTGTLQAYRVPGTRWWTDRCKSLNPLCISTWASQVTLVTKHPSANAGDNPGSILGGEDPLEEGMATHSSILAWRTPWTAEPGGLYLHFTLRDEVSETQKGEVTCSKSHRWQVEKLGFKLRSCDLDYSALFPPH